MLWFHWAHIWSCPPSEGDDYIFHCKPAEQKIPKHKRLVEWYRNLLEKAVSEKVIVGFNNIYTQALDDGINSPTQLPYFEGDFWPNIIEESIREISQEEEERKKTEAMQAAAIEAENSEENQDADTVVSSTGKKTKGTKGSKKKNKKNKGSKTPAKKSAPNAWGGCELAQRIFATMDKYKEVFFVIRFHLEGNEPTGKIEDPDSTLSCDIMDGRDAFLTTSREKHWEFSSFRRAKFSTMATLVELHNQGSDRFLYSCNLCKRQIITRHHCTVCEDFDLCLMCYKEKGHEHPMEKLGLDIDNEHPTEASKKSTVTAQEARRQSIDCCIKSLEHATYCDDKQCSIQSCIKMKKIVSHAKNCKRKNNQRCPICRQLIALCCFHAKFCTKQQCLLPYCHPIKAKLQEQQLQQKLHQRQVLRRRIAQMNRSQKPPTPVPAPQSTIQPIQTISQKPTMRSLANITHEKPMNQMAFSSLSTPPPPNAMVQSTPIMTQQPIDMSPGIKPSMPMNMGNMVPNQPRFVGPSNNFQPGMSNAANIMGTGSPGMMNQMNAAASNEWAAMMAQRQNQIAAHQAQLNNMSMMGMPGMQQQQNMMSQVPSMQPNMQNPSQMTPHFMQQLMQAMRSGVNNQNIRSNNPQFLNALIRSQKVKQQTNNFMPNMNNPQRMQPGPNPLQMSNQWQIQQQKRLQMRRMMSINSALGYANPIPNQQANPRIMNRQYPQDMPPPGPNMMPTTNQPSPQIMGGGSGRITPGMSNHQMMSPPQQNLQQIPNHSPRPSMSPSPGMRAPSPSPCPPVMSPQHLAVNSPAHPNQALTSPLHSHNSPAQLSAPMDLSATVQQPLSVHSDQGGMAPMQNEISMNTMEPEVEDPGDMLSNFVDSL